MLDIGSLKLQNRLVMAPMSGITNLPFRLMVKKLGPALVTTEMVSAMGLIKGQKKTLDYLKSHPDEKPLAVQIFGSEPKSMSAAAEIAVESGADIIDINMGCPAKKVLKTGAGGALLLVPKKAREIVSAVRRACNVPVTVKMRTGWSAGQPVASELALMLQDNGADAVTIHPRFVNQGFSGQADWTVIACIKNQLSIPVIGNGDIVRPTCALRMKDQTGCDGVMIGRAATGNPWIFSQILALENGRKVMPPTLSDRKNFIMEHFQLLSQSAGNRHAAYAMRGILLRYTRGLPNSTRFRDSIVRIKDLDSLIFALDKFLYSLEETLP
ncbi:MAG: tRNA dihydrouridine synthase DusB [Deltaproteobacteria bacterium]|nr:tRNA dihydrouridine synthase DusB [Deltaproteobacteria bacterium]MBW2033466.1 tRNA dihydrouridine synthase DusB [Deltaproteobacteria bacterium]MBW2113513.1 tRNA dihydrouridine synthase DusB [Deltaproteobacteria bacterium]MBW2358202.1 tRNA dihydrouridine synthase DusB [Deltaproteobacteria bacterium]